MIKRTWRKFSVEKLVAVGIVFILLFLFIYVKMESDRRHTPKHQSCDLCFPVLIPTPFVNPYEGSTNINHTSNGGGWMVRIGTMPHGTKWEAITVYITYNGLPVSRMQSVRPQGGVLWQTNGTGIPKWWAKDGGTTPLMITTEAGEKVVPNPGPSGTGVAIGDLRTMEGATFIITDIDGDSSMSVGDVIIIFANSNGGTNALIGGNGYQLEIATYGTTMASTNLS
jgi:hypothetical protein